MSSKTNLTNKDGDNYDEMSIKDLRILLTLRGYDCSQCLEKSDLIAAARSLDRTDFDEEARKLFRQLNLPETKAASKSRYSNIDPIWKHPTTTATGLEGGTVYVGNAAAANDRRTLRERNIVAIINCQEETSRNYFEDDPSLIYYRFLISRLAYNATRGKFYYGSNTNSDVNEDDDAPKVLQEFEHVFDFIQQHIEKGNSVLIHCLAGAHRAGTTGVAWLMNKTGKGTEEALQLAKKCRPIISPFGTLLQCLHKLDHEMRLKGIIPK